MSNTNKITNYNDILDQQYGKVGTPQRSQFEQEALEFYASQVLLHSRKEAQLTQQELAEKSGIDKSYISRLENGSVQPSIGTFLKLIQALGMKIEITKPIL
ncbi:MAG: helix-turn-helix transcriptional regulator [Flavobacteriaceae bacterium]|nr:helix-turn-helix transcriptional regulator [Flavobacteriaceae bacterium]